MNLNFILENYSWIQGLGLVAVVLISVVAYTLICVRGVTGASLLFKIINLKAKKSWRLFTGFSK